MSTNLSPLAKRFRGLLPVVVDVETAGLTASTDALLEVAIVTLTMQEDGKLLREHTFSCHIEPFFGSRLQQEALQITGIDPANPLRLAIPEKQAIERINRVIRQKLTESGCYRAVLVGQNAWFDLTFLMAASKRVRIRMPFHSFTTFDTASLSAIALGETVLARATRRARIPFDIREAHSAIYDAEKTAELFCHIVNRWKG